MRQVASDQAIAQDLFFLSQRMTEDRRLAFAKLGEVFMDMGRADLAGAIMDHASTQQNKKDLQLHFDTTTFFYFFTKLRLGEKLGQPGWKGF